MKTLYDYLKKTEDWEITVWDKDYDIETYFYKTDNENKMDAWDKAMYELAKLLTITNLNSNGVTVNMSEIIENKIPELKKSDLFRICTVGEIMADINNILSGYVSEEWFTKFVNILKK